jgi:hypothetical protein
VTRMDLVIRCIMARPGLLSYLKVSMQNGSHLTSEAVPEEVRIPSWHADGECFRGSRSRVADVVRLV